MSRRTRAREVVLQALYQLDLNPTADASAQSLIERRLSGEPQLIDFARSLLAGVVERRADLDRSLEEVAANWSVGRMAVTDRNILRLGAYELLHTDTPGGAVINEAIELAKRFGDEQSGPFVNGILDRLLRQQTAGLSGPQDASPVPSGGTADQELDEPAG